MDPLKENVRNALDFSMREKRGLVVLLSIMLLCFLLPDLTYQATSDHRTKLIRASVLEYEKTQAVKLNSKKEKRISHKRFAFNPNSIGEDSLKMLGIPPHIGKRIVNYRNAGGSFKKKEELAGIYGLSDSLYRTLEEWIEIPARKEIPKKTVEPIREVIVLDLNLADSSDLIRLKGIGPAFAGRILKYRNMLGGFVHKDQLSEVYGINDSLLRQLYPKISADSVFIRKLEINSIDKNKLQRHPYFRNKNLVNAILNYRSQHGKFGEPEDLLKIHLVSDSVLQKISPYLDFK